METPVLTRLVGVYDANGTARGELTYFVKAKFGAAHCALCDITHGRLRERADWKMCRDDLPVPFTTYHRDDQPDAVRAAADGATPVVVAETTEGVTVLLGPAELDSCEGSPRRLREMIDLALNDAGLAPTAA